MIETVRRAVCDICGVSAPAALESEDPGVIARGEGWVVRSEGEKVVMRDDNDYCPPCYEEHRRTVEAY